MVTTSLSVAILPQFQMQSTLLSAAVTYVRRISVSYSVDCKTFDTAA